jgi:hypothetical protein
MVIVMMVMVIVMVMVTADSRQQTGTDRRSIREPFVHVPRESSVPVRE